jgi:hypothetical protein
LRKTKEQRFTLVHGFSSFSPWSLGYVVSRPVMRQNMAGTTWWNKAAYLKVIRKKRGKGGVGGGEGGQRTRRGDKKHPSKGMPPMIYFLEKIELAILFL